MSTENTEIAGDYQITMFATLDTGYTESEAKKFLLTLKLAEDATPLEARGGVGVSPTLLNQQTAFTTDLDASFRLKLEPFDPDGDLTAVTVNLGPASSFMTYDENNLELSIEAENPSQLLGDFIVGVSLVDNQGNTNSVPILLSVVCPPNSKNSKCRPRQNII